MQTCCQKCFSIWAEREREMCADSLSLELVGGEAFFLECTNGNARGIWAPLCGLPATRVTEGNWQRSWRAEDLWDNLFLLQVSSHLHPWYSEKANFVFLSTVSWFRLNATDSMLPLMLARRPQPIYVTSFGSQKCMSPELLYYLHHMSLGLRCPVSPINQKRWRMQNPVAWHLVATVEMKVLGVWNLEDIFLHTTRESHVQESYQDKDRKWILGTQQGWHTVNTGLADAMLTQLKYFCPVWKQMVSSSIPNVPTPPQACRTPHPNLPMIQQLRD